MEQTKICSTCKVELPISEFHNDITHPDGKKSQCKSCRAKYYTSDHALEKKRINRYKKGINKPMNKNKLCSYFLGVHVAEQVLYNTFKNVSRMPVTNSGYDFVCGKGYKVDVKSACCAFREENSTGSWSFHIRKNKIADYFLCLAFDNRLDLTPKHIWMIPGHEVNNKTTIDISNSTIDKWSQWERSIDKVVTCCNKMKAKV